MEGMGMRRLWRKVMLRRVTKESLWLYDDDDLYIAYIEREM